MRQIISKKSVLVLLTIAFSAFLLPLYGYAEVVEELLLPRAGDKLRKIELDVKTVSINDANDVDARSAKTIGDFEIQYFNKSKSDADADLYVSYNNQSVLHLKKKPVGFFVKREFKAGQNIKYDICYPYLATGNINYHGKGTYGMFMDVSVNGVCNARWLNNNANIICAENDTLTDCKVLVSERIETRTVVCGDSIEEVLHKGRVTKWFKSGYRYPIIELVEDELTNPDSLYLGEKCVKCFYFPIESQVAQVSEDPVNEELRNNYIPYSKISKAAINKGAKANNTPQIKSFNDSETDSSILKNSNKYSINWTEDCSSITISLGNLLSSSYPIVVKVYDSVGKIYHIAKNKIKMQFDMSECVSGVYFVSIEQSDYSYVEKIVKR